MSAIADSDRGPDEGATGAPAVPHTVPASSASAAGKVAEEAALAMSDQVPHEGLEAQIEAMRKEQQALRDHKKRLHKDLRNAVRKKQRLVTRARRLTDKDLVAVLMMRKNQRETRAHSVEGDDGVGARRPSVDEDAARGARGSASA